MNIFLQQARAYRLFPISLEIDINVSLIVEGRGE